MVRGKLAFRPINQETLQKSMTEQDAFELYRGGIVYWNGSDRNRVALHRPGEVRS